MISSKKRRCSKAYTRHVTATRQTRGGLLIAETELRMDHHTQINQLIQSLPSIAKNDVPVEDSCPICLVPFLDCFQEESGEDESSIGVTKLEGCGHLFCRKEYGYIPLHRARLTNYFLVSPNGSGIWQVRSSCRLLFLLILCYL